MDKNSIIIKRNLKSAIYVWYFSSKKQNSLKNPVYLEKFINNAYLELSNSIKSPNELYLF